MKNQKKKHFKLRLKAELLVGSMLIDDEELFFATSGAGYLRTMEIKEGPNWDPTGTTGTQVPHWQCTNDEAQVEPWNIFKNLLVFQFDFEHQEK